MDFFDKHDLYQFYNTPEQASEAALDIITKDLLREYITIVDDELWGCLDLSIDNAWNDIQYMAERTICEDDWGRRWFVNWESLFQKAYELVATYDITYSDLDYYMHQYCNRTGTKKEEIIANIYMQYLFAGKIMLYEFYKLHEIVRTRIITAIIKLAENKVYDTDFLGEHVHDFLIRYFHYEYNIQSRKHTYTTEEITQ